MCPSISTNIFVLRCEAGISETQQEAGDGFQWHLPVLVEKDLGGPQLAGVNMDGRSKRRGLRWDKGSPPPAVVYLETLWTLEILHFWKSRG